MNESGFETAEVPVPQPPFIPVEPPEPVEHRLPMRFVGSGSEYFRIWIVNLLLTLVTLGIYYPWAKVRRLRYFYGNTLIGDQPLGFHANPRRMLLGYLLVTVLFVLYSLAGQFSPVTGLVAFIVLGAVWPALLKSAMRFKLANTSWRGLRFRFCGSTRDAYMAVLPFFVIGLLFVAFPVILSPEVLADVMDPSELGDDTMPFQSGPSVWIAMVFPVIMMGTSVLLPWFWYRLKKYQHDNYAYGSEQTRLQADIGSFYGVFIATMGVSALATVAAVVLGALGVGLYFLLGLSTGMNPESIFRGEMGLGVMIAFLLGILMLVLVVLVSQLVPRPFFAAKMQNLLWTGTSSRAVGIRSDLRVWPLLKLNLKNWLLMLFTLGLYWPFAAVAVQRIHIEAMEVKLSIDPQTLVDEHHQTQGSATGDLAGDLFGIDIGL